MSSELRQDLLRSLQAPVNLERIIGVSPNLVHVPGAGVNEQEFRRNVKAILGKRTSDVDFSRHFTLFNALSMLASYSEKVELLDYVDAQLEDYILTCRSSSDANGMLCDLIVDHWPEERSVVLASVILEKCRYRHRVECLLHELDYHRFGRNREFRQQLEELAETYVKSESERLRVVGSLVLEIFRTPENVDIRIRLPRLNR
jgi:hypothetical protein